MSDILKQADYAIRNWNLSSGHRTLIESLCSEIDRLQAELAEKDKRIVELDRHRATLEYMDATGEWVTHDQINAAWEYMQGIEEQGRTPQEPHRTHYSTYAAGMKQSLHLLGIVACEECGGTKRKKITTFNSGREFPDEIECDCPNNGWVMEER